MSLLLSPSVLWREEVAQLQEEVHLLRQMKDMLSKDLEETQGGCSANLLSATELRVQLGDKEQELDRAKEALQGQESTWLSSHQGPLSVTSPSNIHDGTPTAQRQSKCDRIWHRGVF